ncbi:blast:Ankyrin repeat and death domain-containing protein 1A [Mytilus galloprovincialis]|uniref:Blast:Ankyrin repeat and death domain-containing protein 1A n=1 Tax=Mytilus galloprovincialis TaxID=29158 RepID=A0A8B6EAN7_MYTGA|nr:blast:Ankyrin repeat and death domain-containing protein 1A [Mytilus galloprovincialis]
MATSRKLIKYNVVNTKGETPLHLAAKNKNQDGKVNIANLLTKGEDINARNKWGQTPLQYAAISGCLQNIEILTKCSGIEINSRDINGYNALQSLIAANDGESSNSDDNLPVMDLLSSDNADIPELPLRTKRTFSIQLRKSLQALINAGIDVNNQTTFGNGILHLIATREENTPLLKFFIANFPDTNLNLINKKNENFLHVYVTHELVEEVMELFESIAKSDHSSLRALLSSGDVLGRTPWNLMIGAGDYTTAENLKTILSYGVSLEVNDTLGNTVLHQICGVSHGEAYGDVLEYLLEIGANINAQNMYGESVLSLTLSEHIFNIFCKFNADLEINDRWGRSALMSIMKYRPLPDLFRTFLIKGIVNVNSSDIYGSTPLHFAAYHNYEEQIEMLLKYGADINARDNLQERPLDTAQRHNSFRCIALLKAADRTAIEHIMTFIRKTMLRDKTFEEILQGLPETIISSCMKSTQDIQTLLQLPLNLKDFMNYLLESFYTRSPKYFLEVESVTFNVNNLVTLLCKQIQKYDSRFEMSVFPSGSMAEGTKIGRPDEFDFILCLDKLNDITDIVLTDNLLKSGFASLKFKSTQVLDEYLPFTDADGYFLPILFLRLFYDYLQRALNESNLWKEGNFYYNVENKMGKIFAKPVFTFDVYWLGSVYKQLRISIDLVPAVYKRGWWPINTDVDKIPLVSPCIKAAGCFLTLQTKARQNYIHESGCISRTCNTEDNDVDLAKKRMLRISAAPAEICLMKSIPNNFRQAYVLAKILKSVCPEIDVETKQYKLEEVSLEYEKPRRTCPSNLIKSYMLKNSVFYVLDKLKMINQSVDELDVSEITIKMYNFLLRCLDGGKMQLRPYFLSSDINVFEKSKELSLNKTFIFHLQREFSIKLVLGILNEKFTRECLAAKMFKYNK